MDKYLNKRKREKLSLPRIVGDRSDRSTFVTSVTYRFEQIEILL